MKISINPDKQKAQSLIKLMKATQNRLNESDKEKYPANTLTDYYDIIHKIMEALLFLEGIKIKGEGAHQEIINYICEKYRLNESQRIFLQDLRDYRNRISYEGLHIDKEFIKTNIKRIEEIIEILIRKTEQ